MLIINNIKQKFNDIERIEETIVALSALLCMYKRHEIYDFLICGTSLYEMGEKLSASTSQIKQE